MLIFERTRDPATSPVPCMGTLALQRDRDKRFLLTPS